MLLLIAGIGTLLRCSTASIKDSLLSIHTNTRKASVSSMIKFLIKFVVMYYMNFFYNSVAGNQAIAPGSWPLPSPLLPPTPLTASLPPISPLSSAFTGANRGYLTPGPSGTAVAHYPYTSSDGSTAPGPLSATAPGYFQWPTQSAPAARHLHHHQPGGHIIPSSSHDIYDHYPGTGFICGPVQVAGTAGPGGGAASNTTAAAAAGNNLPDFDTVFTATLGPHTSHSQ